MNSEDEMDTPVTRRELREELEDFKQHVNVLHEDLLRHIAPVLEAFGSIPPRTAALEEAVADLSPRVVVLERKVFAPKKRRSTKTRR